MTYDGGRFPHRYPPVEDVQSLVQRALHLRRADVARKPGGSGAALAQEPYLPPSQTEAPVWPSPQQQQAQAPAATAPALTTIAPPIWPPTPPPAAAAAAAAAASPEGGAAPTTGLRPAETNPLGALPSHDGAAARTPPRGAAGAAGVGGGGRGTGGPSGVGGRPREAPRLVEVSAEELAEIARRIGAATRQVIEAAFLGAGAAAEERAEGPTEERVEGPAGEQSGERGSPGAGEAAAAEAGGAARRPEQAALLAAVDELQVCRSALTLLANAAAPPKGAKGSKD